MQIENTDDQHNEIIKSQVYDYIQDDYYRRQIEDIESYDEQTVFTVNLDHLHQKNQKVYKELLKNSLTMLKVFEESLDVYLQETTAGYEYKKNKMRISFEGNVGQQTVTPRGLKSSLLNKLIMVEGIVTYISKAEVRLVKSTHFQEQTQKFHFKEYDDQFALRVSTHKTQRNVVNSIPDKDPDNKPLTFEHGLCEFKDFQILGLQEKPENVPVGMLSSSVKVYLQENLVDKAKPGDRVEIIGLFRPIKLNSGTGLFQKAVIAYSIRSITQENLNNEFSLKEIKAFKEISKHPSIIDLFSRSLAPSIQGNEYIKEALILMLLGGNENISKNKTKIRGDINVMLIGDPGTGKSQFLRRILKIAPLAISTSGRGSSGVGLTAAVVDDKETREKRLEAGAMVLADRGVICIDEFDKMSQIDRVAMHEVMEQQTVTISKAGIHTSLNARCSVLAAANPIYGEYFTSKSPSFNIGMMESLLSRFDLIFIVLDQNNVDIDRKISLKVTSNHRYQQNYKRDFMNNDRSGIIEKKIKNNLQDQDLEIYQQYNTFTHDQKDQDILNIEFFKKYISYAKNSHNKPVLSSQAALYIQQKWTWLRGYEKEHPKLTKIMPIGIRSLESMIRIATAYAKLRLSSSIELSDAVNSLKMFMKAFYGGYQEVNPQFFKNDTEILQIGREVKYKRQEFKKVQSKIIDQQNQDVPINNKKQVNSNGRSKKKNGRGTKQQKKKEKELKRFLTMLLISVKQNQHETLNENDLNIDKIWSYISNNFPNTKHPNINFTSQDQFMSIIDKLEISGKIMVSEDIIYLI